MTFNANSSMNEGPTKRAHGGKAHALLGWLALLVAAPVTATPVTLAFNGVVATVGGSPFGIVVSVGDAVSAQFTYDNAIGSDINPSPDVGLYLPASGGAFTVTVGGVLITGSATPAIVVSNNLGADAFQYADGSANPGTVTVDGTLQPTAFMQFLLLDSTQSIFSGDALPASLSLASFDNLLNQLFRDNATGEFFRFRVPDDAVPTLEPGTLALLGLGLAGMRPRRRGVR